LSRDFRALSTIVKEMLERVYCRAVRKLLYAVVPVALASCDGNAVGAYIGAAGGELCLPDRRVCIEIPVNGLPEDRQIFIRPSNENPGGQLSDVWEIGTEGTLFLKEATVTFRYDVLDSGIDMLSPSLVRIYTRELFDGGGYGDWRSLNDSEVDRVKLVVRGNTSHLSPFCLMRTDRLSDGGMPIEGDAGTPRDSGVIICPTCNPPTCTDRLRNGSETDVDCGGPNMCPRCGTNQNCAVNSDCASMRCQMSNLRCRAPNDGGMGGGAGGGSGTAGGGTAGGAAGGTAGGATAGGTAGGATAGGTAGGATAGGTAGGATAGGTAGGATAGGTAGGATAGGATAGGATAGGATAGGATAGGATAGGATAGGATAGGATAGGATAGGASGGTSGGTAGGDAGGQAGGEAGGMAGGS